MNTFALASPALAPLVSAALANAAVATLLALLVVALARWIRRPVVVWCLWLLVLLKLLTPPLVPLGLPVLSAKVSQQPPTTAIENRGPARQSAYVIGATPPGESKATADAPPHSSAQLTAIAQSIREVASRRSDADGKAVGPSPDDEPTIVAVGPSESTAAATSASLSADVAHFTPEPIQQALNLLVLLWIVGSAAWLLLYVVRVARFRRLLAKTRPASPELLAEVDTLAARIGLRSVPRVRLTAARTSPLVWALGRRATLLLPARLLVRLDDAQRSGLLLHELAHLRRRDHWVRWLELAALCLYWWLPTVWWARRRLQQAEEECCDAWVVQTLPHSARAYAKALLETVEFLSAPRVAMPPAASGMSEALQLKRRLNVILHEQPRRRMSWRWRAALAVMALAVLPVAPHLLRAEQQEEPKEVVRPTEPLRTGSAEDEFVAPAVANEDATAGADDFNNRFVWSTLVSAQCMQCHQAPVQPTHVGDAQGALVHQLVAQRLGKQPLGAVRRDERGTLLRRMSLDLRGIVPTPQEIEQFENDERPDAVERAVNGMLAQAANSDHFSRRWSHFLGIDTGAMSGGAGSEDAMSKKRAATPQEAWLNWASGAEAKPEGRDVDAKLARLEKAVDALVAEIRQLRQSVDRGEGDPARGPVLPAPKVGDSSQSTRWTKAPEQPPEDRRGQWLSIATGDRVLTVRGTDGMIRCTNLATGRLLWQMPLGKRIIPQPMVHGDHAFFLMEHAPVLIIVEMNSGRTTTMLLPTSETAWKYAAAPRPVGHDGGGQATAGMDHSPSTPPRTTSYPDVTSTGRAMNSTTSRQDGNYDIRQYLEFKAREKSYENRIKALEDRTEQLLKRLESQQAAPPNSSGAGSENDVLPAPGGADTKPDSNPADNGGAAAAQDKRTNP